MESRLLLSKLTPMKPILCIVRSPGSNGLIGTAISDAYLGFAAPTEFAPSSNPDDVQRIIGELRPGALTFGLPMTTQHQKPFQSLLEIQIQRDALLHKEWSIPLRCAIDAQLSLEEARHRKEMEWDMWEEIDLPQTPCSNADEVGIDPSTEAAVSLNAWLWEHCGGWRNTFG